MKIQIDDLFWNEKIKIIQEQMLPFQWRVLNDEEPNVAESGTIKNFKIAAGESEGKFKGMVFQDSDLYKWLEAAAYSLKLKPDKQLQAWADEAIQLIAKAQLSDGYIDTYFQIYRPDLRWKNLSDNHELYSMGHLIEAGVAYYEVCKNQIILDVIKKVADHLTNRFGYGKLQGLPGHPEIEIALIRLFQLTGEKSYLELAKYFILERGKKPNYFMKESQARIDRKEPSWIDLQRGDNRVLEINKQDFGEEYFVSSKPLIYQMVAEGHAVRAGYLYCALTDLAALEKDPELQDSARRLFDNVINKQMYVTGGIGQKRQNEGFSYDYDLPIESNYCETCAGISLIFWAKRMYLLGTESKYGDVIERALYNNTLGAMALDGQHFYYRNELERWGENVVDANRPAWYSVACCPPNLARLLLSLENYIAHEERNVLYIDQYIGCVINGELVDGSNYQIKLKSKFPWNGRIELSLDKFSSGNSLALRIPSWSQDFKLSINQKTLYEGIDFTINRGYAIILQTLISGDKVEICFDFSPKLVFGNTKIKQIAGKAVVMMGPLVYCLEEEDNGQELWQIQLDSQEKIEKPVENQMQGYISLNFLATREESLTDELYHYHIPQNKIIKITAIPYFLRYNRSIGELQVWNRIKK